MKSTLRMIRRAVASARVRAALSLGVVFTIGVTGTFAYWTDNATIGGASFTSGTLDLQVNGGDSYATTALSMGVMVPGNTSAEVLTIKNFGTAPLKYTLTGGLTGTDAAAYNTAAAIKLKIVLAGTKSGTGSSSTCTTGAGTTTLVNAVSLTSTTNTAIIATPRGPLTQNATEALCFQITFDAAAPTGLQGKITSATFMATGTSDLS